MKFFRKSQSTDTPDVNSEFLLNPISRWSQAVTLTLISLSSFGLIFAFFTRIEEVVIARGDLESSIPIQNIYPPIGGFVSNVLVKEGELIEVNQPLIQIETDLTIKTKNIIKDQIKIENERSSAETKILEFQKESLIESKKNQSKILLKLDSLLNEGGISQLEYLDRKEKYFDTVSKIYQKDSEIIKINKDSEKILNGFKKELEQINKTLSYKNIRSSIKGKVFDLRTIQPGILIRDNENEPIMKIVPIDSLFAKIFISNKDIGFINVGQKAKIRIDSYPFTEFGEIDGVLKDIADEVVFLDNQSKIPFYPATVKLNKQYLEKNGNKYSLISGQTVQVNLISRNKRVITILTDVFTKSIDSLKSIRTKPN